MNFGDAIAFAMGQASQGGSLAAPERKESQRPRSFNEALSLAAREPKASRIGKAQVKLSRPSRLKPQDSSADSDLLEQARRFGKAVSELSGIIGDKGPDCSQKCGPTNQLTWPAKAPLIKPMSDAELLHRASLQKSSMTLGEAVALTLKQAADEQQSSGTLRSYTGHGKRILAFWGSEVDLGSITRLQVQEWVNVRRRECAAASVSHGIAFLSRVFRTAGDLGYILVPPTLKVRLPKINNRRQRVLSIDEEESLKKYMKPKHFSVVQFAIHTGLRRLELFRLVPADIRLWREDGVVVGMAHIRTSKTGVGRSTPLNPVAASIARDWLKMSFPYVFPPFSDKRYEVGQSYSAVLRRACKFLGINDLRWHDLRHTCASRALQNGAKLEQVQALLGHSNILQTQRYCHWGDDYVWPAAMAVCKSNNREGVESRGAHAP